MPFHWKVLPCICSGHKPCMARRSWHPQSITLILSDFLCRLITLPPLVYIVLDFCCHNFTFLLSVSHSRSSPTCPIFRRMRIISCSSHSYLPCIQKTLRQPVPSPAHRMICNEMRCSLYSPVCTYTELDVLLCTIMNLPRRVDQLIEEQTASDYLHEDPVVTNIQSPFN